MIWAVLLALLFFPVVGVAEEAPLDEVEVPARENAPSAEVVMQGMGMISSMMPAVNGRVPLTLDVTKCMVGDCGTQVNLDIAQFLVEEYDIYAGCDLTFTKMTNGGFKVGIFGIPRKMKEAAEPILKQRGMVSDEMSDVSRRLSILDGVVKRFKSDGKMSEAEVSENEMKGLQLKLLHLLKEHARLSGELNKIGYRKGPTYEEEIDKLIQEKETGNAK